MATATKPLPYQQRLYLAEALDPIHIGTGEFRLGRVDNTIVREAGTNLPKIPGSSIGGVARAYTAMMTGDYLNERNNKLESCAGKGGKDGMDHCGRADCRVCTTYGFSKRQKSFQGMAQFGDARILFFPVYSVAGPVWVTCPTALHDGGVSAQGVAWLDWNTRLALGESPSVLLLNPSRTMPSPLNLGWLYLPKYTNPEGVGNLLPEPESWTISDGQQSKKLIEISGMKPVLERLVMVSDSVFSMIVDDQLEVRTSVSISPATGAAESGALFTAEAIPRATVLFFRVTFLDPANFRVPNGGAPSRIQYNGRTEPATVKDIEANVWLGLGMIEAMGIGGVNTRGMGRLRVASMDA